jgi:hypothetical protein
MIAGGVPGFVALGATLASSFVLWRVAGVALAPGHYVTVQMSVSYLSMRMTNTVDKELDRIRPFSMRGSE